MKIVLDTNILVRAFSNPLGPANRLLNQLLADDRGLYLAEIYSLRLLVCFDMHAYSKFIGRMRKLSTISSDGFPKQR